MPGRGHGPVRRLPALCVDPARARAGGRGASLGKGRLRRGRRVLDWTGWPASGRTPVTGANPCDSSLEYDLSLHRPGRFRPCGAERDPARRLVDDPVLLPRHHSARPSTRARASRGGSRRTTSRTLRHGPVREGAAAAARRLGGRPPSGRWTSTSALGRQQIPGDPQPHHVLVVGQSTTRESTTASSATSLPTSCTLMLRPAEQRGEPLHPTRHADLRRATDRHPGRARCAGMRRQQSRGVEKNGLRGPVERIVTQLSPLRSQETGRRTPRARRRGSNRRGR